MKMKVVINEKYKTIHSLTIKYLLENILFLFYQGVLARSKKKWLFLIVLF